MGDSEKLNERTEPKRQGDLFSLNCFLFLFLSPFPWFEFLISFKYAGHKARAVTPFERFISLSLCLLASSPTAVRVSLEKRDISCSC